MLIPTITKDPKALTMTVTVELDVPVERAGSRGPTRASSSSGGARRRIPRRSKSTSSCPAVA